KETYALLHQFEKAGGTQGSERLEGLLGMIQKVLMSIDRMDLHRDDPIPAEEERHRERFGRPDPDESFTRRASGDDQAHNAS
ncbi:MAG: hypothetical protein M3Q49_04330, partial [Actinomycetota bacterium]|nr:hypothetical protein [Actinomycetota bacterium]